MALRWELSSPFGFSDYVYSVGAWRMRERETHASCPHDIAGLCEERLVRAICAEFSSHFLSSRGKRDPKGIKLPYYLLNSLFTRSLVMKFLPIMSRSNCAIVAVYALLFI
ncbi:hypothetical protein TNCT_708741 [Trichonephila clavata]|uniref:Uncharacterized protein n=1 Tax=Trichonephila clavata TaxID=2740835 RepID=A0A8X6F078_TRICU|nr:hypothetical protein TNCT_708741 [Trichonephila clavata]